MSWLGPVVAAVTVLLLTIVALIYSLCVTAKHADRQIERMQQGHARRNHPTNWQ